MVKIVDTIYHTRYHGRHCTTSDIVTDNYKLKGLFYKRLNPREYLKNSDNPSVVGFSLSLE